MNQQEKDHFAVAIAADICTALIAAWLGAVVVVCLAIAGVMAYICPVGIIEYWARGCGW